MYKLLANFPSKGGLRLVCAVADVVKIPHSAAAAAPPNPAPTALRRDIVCRVRCFMVQEIPISV